MAAGVDELLPAVFARVHPRWATPHFSILLLGAIASFLIIAVQTGESVRGAYNTLVSLMTIGSSYRSSISMPARGSQDCGSYR